MHVELGRSPEAETTVPGDSEDVVGDRVGAVYDPLLLAELGGMPEEEKAVPDDERDVVEEVVFKLVEFETGGPQVPVSIMLAFVPPVVPSLLTSISSQKSLRIIC